ncbi:uncharacterized protein LOC117321371 [Pecten maximus]|uniref:uncharacterized protein LOC117315801 n=1 Tax=Pecten maximus TaxID=6579 RepID=UPI001458B435|nr:uncharacterized protein LOC117315801 [Pecten maximus]XP_033731706.1 uncharacterized protein LOC117321371 [Pecten maximus]
MNISRKVKVCVTLTGCAILLLFLNKGYLSRESSHTSLTAQYLEVRKQPALITLFTTWKTFPARYDVYNNTLRNWPRLLPHVNIIVFTDDHIPDKYKQLGWTVLPLKHQVKGHPILKHMFLEAIQLQPHSQLYGFANADLLFTDSLVESLRAVVSSPVLFKKTFLVVGRRMNTPNITREEASSWRNIAKASKRGNLMEDTRGIDYFITPPNYHWSHILDVQVGQNLYDNWLVWDAQKMGYPVIDVTNTLLAVHQDAPYPKQHGRMNQNLVLIKVPSSKLYRGVVACCDLHTVHINRTIRLQRKKLPKNCF